MPLWLDILVLPRSWSWWNFIEDYVRTCATCCRAKIPRHHLYGLLQPLPPPTKPWQSISIFHYGSATVKRLWYFNIRGGWKHATVYQLLAKMLLLIQWGGKKNNPIFGLKKLSIFCAKIKSHIQWKWISNMKKTLHILPQWLLMSMSNCPFLFRLMGHSPR